jgi:S1-C subfamily serine protease
MIVGLASVASAAEDYTGQAQTLKTMGLFLGTDKGLELQKTATRAEAAVMMVRLLGKEDYAKNAKLQHPFKDVPSWADTYVGYLYKSGLTKGQSASVFGSHDNITADQYTTYILRALDYDDSKGDFAWDQALTKYITSSQLTADESQYFSSLSSKQALSRNDLVAFSYKALFATLKDSSITLLQKLYIIDEVVSPVRMQLAQQNDSRIAQLIGDISPSTDKAKPLTAMQIYEKCSDAVFYIKVYDANKHLIASASGFFINAKGLAVTNYHVIENAHSAEIKLSDNKTYNVSKVLGYDKNKDIAILQINADIPTYLKQGDSHNLYSGQQIYTISSPLSLQNSISEGIIGSPQRIVAGQTYIQITAPISSGSSGGALLNEQGEVIGITTGGFEGGQNLNVAIPIHELANIPLSSHLTLSQMTEKEKPAPDPTTTIPAVGDKIYEEEEPNNDSRNSNFITNGTTVRGELADAYDEDIYCFSANQAGRLIMALTCNPIHLNNIAVGLYWQRSVGYFQLIDIASINYENNIHKIDTNINAGGTYYLRIIYDTSKADNMYPYAWYMMYYALIY